ncbi:hypothetical protein [Paenibacillus sp. GCM10028914]|uniref:phosphatase domain-containing putative toxin n=1 Tax=Paenibacillus sp. GCM10028914 TaxID=3273416 RepID=UPI00360C429B
MSEQFDISTSQVFKLIDCDNNQTAEHPPKRFRMCIDSVEHESSTIGLHNLKASASGQFSLNGLKYMKSVIPNDRLTVVDLRQECHGFVNGMAISWYSLFNDSNRDLSQEAVIKLERQYLDELIEVDKVEFDYIEGKSFQLRNSIISPKQVHSEAELTAQEGVGYIRFCVTDHHRPSDAIVDEFITFVKALSSGEWLHFHCRGGVGRATTFILMYDMIRNAKQVSLDDILLRQQKIGGRDMYRLNPEQGLHLRKAALERLSFIHAFYAFCASEQGIDHMNWQSWLQTQT